MPSFPLGQRVFENRTEYPLPNVEGTSDYIFHFVPADDAYGAAARKFLTKFYPRHRSRSVDSLESLIAHLHDEVSGQGVTHIREIVIVAHAVPGALLFPVVSGREQYKYVSARSLVDLQQDLPTRFATFAANRKIVVERLSSTSWVTVRACNFGQSHAAMFALYSFFGGRANVYASTAYQYFGLYPIRHRAPLENVRAVHEHLVMQRFIPTDTHTPDRKDLIVRALVDHAPFSEPVDLFTVAIDDVTSPAALAYAAVIAGLNKGRVVEALEIRLSQADITLGKKGVKIVRKDTEWIIPDTVTHQGESYPIEYHVSEVVAPPNATMRVQATIKKVYSEHHFPIQRFFDEEENNKFRGRLFSLASYVEATDVDPDHKAEFQAVLSLLDNRDFGGPASVDIKALFDKNGFGLTPGATLAVVALGRAWQVVDAVSFMIRLDRPYTRSGNVAPSLFVYLDLRDLANGERQAGLVVDGLGADPDLPGPELLSYLDNRSFDEVADLLDHLRNPYRPEHTPYIYHAIQALQRKRGYLRWKEERLDIIGHRDDALFAAVLFPYEGLEDLETVDKQAFVYSFDTNKYWAEVKAANPPTTPVLDDLFTEQVLAFPPDQLPFFGEIEPDSPATDLERMRALGAQGIDQFFATSKFTIDVTPPLPDTSCAQFKELVDLLKSLQGLSEEEIEAVLNDTTLFGEVSLFTFYGAPKPLMWLLAFWNMSGADPTLGETILAKLGRLPMAGLGTSGINRLFVLVARSMPLFAILTLAGDLYWNFLKEQANALERSEQIGKVTAIRQWLRKLIVTTRTQENDFPTTLALDIGTDPMAAYLAEMKAQYKRFGEPVPPLGLDRLRKGFEEGAKLVEAHANEVLSQTDRIIDYALMQGGLDACKIQVMRDAGIIDPSKARALVMRQFADAMLRIMPRI
jgi:hypothetical protein